MLQLKAEKFDAAINSGVDNCGYGVFKKIGVEKYISVSPTALPESMAGYLGVPNPASIVPCKNCVFVCLVCF